MSDTYVGIHSIRVVGTTVSPGGVTYTDNNVFSLTILDPCLFAVLTDPGNANEEYYVGEIAMTVTISAS